MPPERDHGKSRARLTEFEEVFGTSSLVEPFDRPAALYLQQYMGDYAEDGDPDDASSQRHWQEATDSLIKESRGTDSLVVSYKKGTSTNDKGRWVSTVRGSMQSMPDQLRNTIYSDWIDIRFTNSFATLFLGICKNLNIAFARLDAYVREQDEVLDELIEAGAADTRQRASQLMERVMRGGDVQGIAVPWWREFCDGVMCSTNNIATNERYTELFNACKQKKATVNLNTRTLVSIVHEAENNCLEYLYNYLYDNGCIPERKCSLAFDRVMVPRVISVTDKVSDQDFLDRGATFIQERTGFFMQISSKNMGPPLDLPYDYDSMTNDIFVIEPGEDSKAAEEFVRRFSDRLIVDNGRKFWRQDNFLYTDHPETVRLGVYNAISEMKIFLRNGEKNLLPYGTSGKHADACMKFVFAKIPETDGFVEKLFRSSLGYLAFDDGVYCFSSGSFMPYPVEGVYFTRKIKRRFPVDRPSDEDMAEFMSRVIDPIFPDAEVRDYFLHRLARAAAGSINDKRWHVAIGERDSGKSLLCYLLELTFQGFVDTFSAESLQVRHGSTGDAAKAQSWMSRLEFVRIALSNEVPLGVNGSVKIDGNMVKRVASGGDRVQLRTNYQDEKTVRLQATLFLCCNRFPQIEPEDAYHTLRTIDFHTKFVPQAEITERGDSCPEHWKPADVGIKTWVEQDHVIDTFLWIVLDAYGDGQMLEAPKSVTQFTTEFAEGANKPEIDKVGEIVKYEQDPECKVLIGEIKHALKQAKVDITSQLVRKHIDALYGKQENPPVYKKIRKLINGQYATEMGWTNLSIERVAVYNERDVNQAERFIRSELIKESLNGNGKRDIAHA